ncbi:MAG: Outer membrane protein assembly factor BamD [Owenweeksia sp. TMED14]|nr:MAG: Outer membrane protein assembly factor BamD [Owenweeksia sp. TMED14]|tara:strand:- start:826 stop:1626 length:801 start_codon:yes stop_codon:yes gene_type:complete
MIIIRFLLISAIFCITSCGDYQKVLKSSDPLFKLENAISYFEENKFNKAFPILDELMSSFRGTTRAQEVYKYYALTLYGQKDYILAGYHFKTFSKTFPSDDFAEESAYLTAYCYYLEAPGSTLDPAYIFKAMDELQLFINSHPESNRAVDCNNLIDELRERLEQKSFDIAKGYFHRTNYSSAVTSFNVMLSEYPDSPFREQAMSLRFRAAYELAKNSIKSREKDRYVEANTSFLEFRDSYPDSPLVKETQNIYNKVQAFLEKDISQ